MVKFLTVTAAALAAIVPSAQAGFGNGWDDKGQTSFITHFSTNIEMPKTPSPQEDWLVLWPALQGPKALMQPILGSYANPPCDASSGQWCVFTYTLLLPDETVKQGPTLVPISAGTQLHIAIDHKAGIEGYHQTIRKGGASGTIISQRQDANIGLAHRAEFHVECNDEFSQATPRHVYTNTKIVFAKAITDFKGYASTSGVEVDGFTTSDGGKTWHINKLIVKKGTCDPNSKSTVVWDLDLSGNSTVTNSTITNSTVV